MHLFAPVLGLLCGAALYVGDDIRVEPDGSTSKIQCLGVDRIDGQFTFHQTQLREVPYFFRRPVNIDGKTVTVIERCIKEVARPVRVRCSIKDYRAYTASGKTLSTEEVLGRLRPGVWVLLSENGKDLDVASLRNESPETLVLVRRVPPMQQPAPKP
jgi:hypothetical protein